MPSSPDQLALERTRLANERTLLAYVRTALGAAGGGVGLLEFVDEPAVGWGLVAAGGALLLFGLARFFVIRRRFER
jgi:putative membrane protein